ncbi:MAG: hypothetical protein ACI4T4_04650 [Limosilactobacillus sp.]
MRISVKAVTLAIAAVVLMVLVSLLSVRFILPTGAFVAPWAGIISLAVLLSAGAGWAFLITFVALIIMMMMGTAGWLAVIDILLTVALLAWLIGWQLPRDQDVSHQQLIFLGLVAGLLQLILIEGGLALVGWLFDGQNATAWAFIQLGFSTSVLTALLYAVLTPLLAIMTRWLWQHWVVPSGNNDSQK